MDILILNRYEQLLALPPPSSGAGRESPGSNGGGGGKLHSCLVCGKMFTTAEDLFALFGECDFIPVAMKWYYATMPRGFLSMVTW